MKRALGQSRELFLCIEREEDANKALKALHSIFELEGSETAVVKGDLPNV